MWVFLAVLSAIGLGFYDICKKRALATTKVVPVLTGSVAISSLLLLPLFLVSRLSPGLLEGTLWYVPTVTLHEHLLILLKSTLVLSSWVCAYYAMRRLPITVVTPINATRPMWTLLGAVLIFGESLNPWQWAGVAVALVSFFAFAHVSMPKTKISRHRESEFFPYLMLFGAVLLGAASGLYDKHLMRHIDHNAVLTYYTWYQMLMMVVVFLVTSRCRFSRPSLSTITNIAGISLFLTLADFVYLLALSDPDSLIAVVSLVRRGSVLITFAYGVLVLHEKDIARKAVCLAGILIAMILLLMGSIA